MYGLSTDSAKSNTNFATKQSLPFPLLCDPSGTLIGAIGMKKAPKSTTRGVVVIDKEGKVNVWEQAGPQKTVDAVMGYVQAGGTGATSAAAVTAPPPAPASDTTMADAPSATETTAASSEMVPATTTEMAPATSDEMAPASTTEKPAPTTADAQGEPTTATGLLPASSTSMAFATATPETGPLISKEEPPKMDEVPLTKEASAEEVKAAETAAEVGETAAKIDSAEEVKP